MIKKYNKLVRDKIPELIKQRGDSPVTETLDDEKRYLKAVHRKLSEEIDEYHTEHNVDEFADVLEVIYTLAKYYGKTPEYLEQLRLEKYKERGGFDNKTFLVEVERVNND